MSGFGSRPNVLSEVNVENADMVVAVIDSDEVNIVACMNAGALGATGAIKIARVRDPRYGDPKNMSHNSYGLDLMDQSRVGHSRAHPCAPSLSTRNGDI
jgi:trk system potassium uptake protein TrkA